MWHVESSSRPCDDDVLVNHAEAQERTLRFAFQCNSSVKKPPQNV